MMDVLAMQEKHILIVLRISPNWCGGPNSALTTGSDKFLHFWTHVPGGVRVGGWTRSE